MKKISIVIPVYNVELYIDQCLESVCSQTYQDLEIIIVYDKSSDQTYDKCLHWLEKDSRICLIHNQSRNGLGAARNQAILRAKGEYITFLDSDDWMENTYIQRLHDFMEKNSVDFVASSEWYAVDGEFVSGKSSLMEMVIEGREKDIVFTLHPTAWGKFCKRDWMIKHKILYPEIFTCEDWGTLPLMILQANRIGIMSGPGVFHRVARPGALTDLNNKKRIDFLKDAKFAFEYFLDYAKNYNLLQKNEFTLEKYCRKKFDLYSWSSKQEDNQEGIKILEQIKTEVLQKYFPDMFQIKNSKYYLFGSFSLRWEFQQAFGNWEECMRHYCFSSIISAMTPCTNINVKHKNYFRQTQICHDIASDMIQTISKNKEEALFLIDFLEERYGVAEISDNCYCTYSEALKESNIGESHIRRIIDMETSEYWKMWTEKCDELIKFLSQYFTADKVILVRNRMALAYGNLEHLVQFKKQDKLIQINNMINKMENYFLEHYSKCVVVDVDDKYLITDVHFRQGCKPEHANDVFYEQVGMQLYEKIVWPKEHK